MNLSEYKISMDEIRVDTSTLEASIHQKIKRQGTVKRKKAVASFAVAAALILCMLFVQDFSPVEPAISVTVYAAENEAIQLTDDFTDIKANANTNFGGYSTDPEGNTYDASVNYNIYFKCEGQDIESITYSVSDEELSRYNSNLASAYYVENLTIPMEEYVGINWKDDTILNAFYGEGEEVAHVTKLIGGSYTVPYDDQMSKQYGLVVKSSVTEDDKFHFEDFTIKVNIKLKNGSSLQKELLVHVGDDAISSIEMKLL